MKNIFLNIFIFFILILWFENNSTNAENETDKIRIFVMKQQGWKVVGKQSLIEKRPGLKPYSNLKRLVQVVKYKLRKGKKILFCKVEYDSQLDKINDVCNSPVEN